MSNLINIDSLNRDQGHNVSDRYKVIKTGDLVKNLEAEGYFTRELKVQKSRKNELQGFGVHALRLRHSSLVLNHEGLTPEIILRNSYNGTSCFEIMMGVFRLVCSNGLVVGTKYASLKVRHVGEVMPKVLNAMSEIQSQTETMKSDIETFSSIQLIEGLDLELARRVASQLIPVDATKDVGPIQGTIKAESLLKIRRQGDQGQDLWTVLNRIQENSLNGGLRYMSRNEKGEIRNQSMRAVNAIDRSIQINRLVWDAASQIATELK